MCLSKYSFGGKFMKIAVFSKVLTFALAPMVFDQIKALTNEQRISMGEWLRKVIDLELARTVKDKKHNNKEKE